jgi:hypothetical protein
VTRLKPKGPLPSPEEFEALGDIARHRVVPKSIYHRLQILGLIEQKSGTWTLTGEKIRLQRGAIDPQSAARKVHKE